MAGPGILSLLTPQVFWRLTREVLAFLSYNLGFLPLKCTGLGKLCLLIIDAFLAVFSKNPETHGGARPGGIGTLLWMRSGWRSRDCWACRTLCRCRRSEFESRSRHLLAEQVEFCFSETRCSRLLRRDHEAPCRATVVGKVESRCGRFTASDKPCPIFHQKTVQIPPNTHTLAQELETKQKR